MQGDLALLRRLANAAHFDQFLAEAQRQVEAAGEDAASLLGVGSVYFSFGYLTLARERFKQAAALFET